MANTTNLFTYKQDTWGCVEVFDPAGRSIAFLQGDDASCLLEGLAQARHTLMPAGPFQTTAELVSVILSDYAPDAYRC